MFPKGKEVASRALIIGRLSSPSCFIPIRLKEVRGVSLLKPRPPLPLRISPTDLRLTTRVYRESTSLAKRKNRDSSWLLSAAWRGCAACEIVSQSFIAPSVKAERAAVSRASLDPRAFRKSRADKITASNHGRANLANLREKLQRGSLLSSLLAKLLFLFNNLF